MVIGVTEGYSKSLEIVGTGYRVQAKGADLEFALGFSHPVMVDAARGHHASRSRHPTRFTRHGHRQAAGRRGRRQHPQAAQARARTRARACGTPARSSAARSERLVSKPWQSRVKQRHQTGKRRRAQASPHPRAQEGQRHAQPSAPGRHAARPATCSCRSSTTRRPHAGVGLDDGGRPARARAATRPPRPRKVGELVAERAKAAGVEAVVFDRGGNSYHGRVAAIADGAREGGLNL